MCLPVYIGWSGNASRVRGRLSGDLTQNISLPLAYQVLHGHPGLALTSPHRSLLHHSAPGTLAFLLFLKPAKLVPTSEPFRFPFLLPGNLFLQIFAWLASSLHSGLCSSVHSSGRRSPTTLPSQYSLHTTPPPRPALVFSWCILQHDIIFVCSVSLTCKLHQDRAFVLFITVSQHSLQWCLIHVFCVLVLIVMIVTFSFLNCSFLGSVVGMSPLYIPTELSKQDWL